MSECVWSLKGIFNGLVISLNTSLVTGGIIVFKKKKKIKVIITFVANCIP